MSDNQTLYKAAIATWGERAQRQQTVEECAELIVAIQHYHRASRSDPLMPMIEEMADVEIMIEQMKIIYGGKEWNAFRKLKLKRLKALLEPAAERGGKL